MPWARIDDREHSSPTRRLVSVAADGVLYRALSRSAEHLTDGFVEESWVLEQLPRGRARRAVLAELEQHLFDRVDAGERFAVPPDGEYYGPGYVIRSCPNLSRLQVYRLRKREREKKSEQRERRRQDALPWSPGPGGDNGAVPRGVHGPGEAGLHPTPHHEDVSGR